MKKYLAISTFLLTICMLNTALAGDPSSAVSWDRSSALAAAYSVNINQAVSAIGEPSLLLNGARTIKNLKVIESRQDWPLPAREATLYQFTQSLAGLPREAVSQDIMRHLSSYEAKVLVPHEDHANAAVPLFNVRGAARGVENGWLRSESSAEAAVLLATAPDSLLDKYLDSNQHSQKSGYLDALQHTDKSNLQAIQSKALEQLPTSPGLSPLLAKTVVLTADPYAARRLLVDGHGTGLATAFKTLGAQQTSSQRAELLHFAINEAPTENAALAIAAWWPSLRSDPATRQLLTGKLGDDKLGAQAALALAQSPDIQTIRELQLIAEGDSIAARRAQMALNLNRDLLTGEMQP